MKFLFTFLITFPILAQNINWQVVDTVTTPRSYFYSFDYYNRIYVLGGVNSSGTVLGKVEVAEIQSNNTLGNWSTLLPITTDLYQFGGGVDYTSGYIYYAGGVTHWGPLSSVMYSQIQSDGTILNWQITTALPEALLRQNGLVHNNYFYQMGGVTSTGLPIVTDNVRISAINVDGTLQTWQSTTDLPSARAGAVTLTYNSHLYYIGGFSYSSGYVGSSDCYINSFNVDGTLNSWVQTSSLPEPIFDAAGCIINGTIYLFGGKNGPNTIDKIYYSKIQSDGSLSTWQLFDVLPVPLSSHQVVLTANGVYVIGGENDATGYQELVYFAGMNEFSGLVAYYPFNGNANDESGNYFHGSTTGGVTWVSDRFDNPSSACRVDGDLGSVLVPDFPPLNSKFSIACWLKVLGPFSGSDPTGSFCMYGTINEHMWNFAYSQNSTFGASRWNFWNNYNGSHSYLYDIGSEWTFVTIVYDSLTEKVYSNGIFIGSISVTTPLTPIATDTLRMGRMAQGPGIMENFNGILDDYRIFDRALTEAEILTLYTENGWIGGEPCPGTPTVTYESKTYNTVQIGDQCWLKENLDVGTRIDGVQNQSNNQTIEKYCYNDDPNNCIIYGGLYQWNETMQYITIEGAQGICPDGWHLPTSSEYQTLANVVNNNSDLLIREDQRAGATNSSGFSALLSGHRRGDTGWLWYPPNQNAHFWSSTSYSSSESNYLLLDYPNVGSTLISPISNDFGLQVRCIKGDGTTLLTPTLLSPPNGEINIWTSPTLGWNASIGATSYRVQVSSSDQFTSTVFDQGNITEISQQITGLNFSTTYFWRVNATNGNYTTDWSSVWSFTTVDSLAAYYPFNSNANDESGNGNNGTAQGEVTWTVNRFNDTNTAAHFNGTTSYISLPGTWGGHPELTISAWVKPFMQTNDYYAIVSSNQWNYFLHFQISDNPASGIGVYTIPTIFDINPAPLSTPTNEWRHLVLVIKSGSSKVYQDGVEFTYSDQVFTSLSTSDAVCIARGFQDGRFFNGDLDDIRIFNKALSENEIKDLYHEGGWGYTTWRADITVIDAGNASKVLTFGQDPTATDSLDLGLGEIELPPLPPPSIFDARFDFPVIPPIQSYLDLRNDTLEAIDWQLYFQGNYPITISWNPGALPYGTFFLVDGLGGIIVNVNMKTDSFITITNNAISKLYIKYGRQNNISVNVNNGWNMVSAPLLKPDMSIVNYYPGYIPNAYKYVPGGGYQIEDTLELGRGYWMKFSQAKSYAIEALNHRFRIPIQAGWNMIGPFDFLVPVGNITTEPAGIISSNFFEYNNGYLIAATLKPGKGYWLKANAAGKIILDPSILVKGSKDGLAALDDQWNKILVEDATGNRMTLYISEESVSLELPPSPPSGIFDVRYTTGNLVEDITKESKQISISGASYPITFSVEGGDVIVSDIITGKMINELVRSGERVVISDPNINILKVSEDVTSTVPVSYELFQNYPNPFNPNTLIKFSIPKEVLVSLGVYNILGEKVKDLKNEIMKPGYYEVEFDASDLASGIYLYRINAGDYLETKKMILLK